MFNVTKAILQSLVGKSLSGFKTSDDNLVLEFKTGEKLTLHVNLNKGVGYASFKEKPSTKAEKAAKSGERILSNPVPDPPKPKRRHVKKEKS